MRFETLSSHPLTVFVGWILALLCVTDLKGNFSRPPHKIELNGWLWWCWLVLVYIGIKKWNNQHYVHSWFKLHHESMQFTKITKLPAYSSTLTILIHHKGFIFSAQHALCSSFGLTISGWISHTFSFFHRMMLPFNELFFHVSTDILVYSSFFPPTIFSSLNKELFLYLNLIIY